MLKHVIFFAWGSYGKRYVVQFQNYCENEMLAFGTCLITNYDVVGGARTLLLPAVRFCI